MYDTKRVVEFSKKCVDGKTGYLDNVIDSGPATYAIKGTELGGGGVMESEESIKIGAESEIIEEEPEDNISTMGDSEIRPAGPTRAEPEKRAVSRREVSGRKSASARKGPPRRNNDANPPPKPKKERKASIQDDDFSDFSL